MLSLQQQKKAPKSRRIIQRRKKRLAKRQLQRQEAQLTQALRHTTALCQANFGFHADPKLTLQTNFNKTLKDKNCSIPALPNNLTFHNLCSSHSVPTGSRQLLGLNLKFCVAPKYIPNNINKTVRPMAYSIRTAYFLKKNGATQDADYIKQIHLKKQTMEPSASLHGGRR